MWRGRRCDGSHAPTTAGRTQHLQHLQTTRPYRSRHERPTRRLCHRGGGILIKGDFNAYHEVIWARRNKWTSYFRSDGESAWSSCQHRGTHLHSRRNARFNFRIPPHQQHVKRTTIFQVTTSLTTITLNCSKPTTPLLPPPLQHNKRNWRLFQDTVPHIITTSTHQDTLDATEQLLVEAFHHTANTATPHTKHPKQQYKDRWYYNDRDKEYNHRVK